ncbi:sterol desaturase family protein [Dyadobacter sp. CY312]|uniref:sterol desaturase family protein n=1 Tax=Dyadobacter sp. CY312 TaxID=2907303 RepID=UPI001F3F8473|nr:sterol desaturase family protein [Dyadobacter sp. CY312]MCE7040790.1 sterol desaturase family protein [Dyadobacter sp. CY312]
MDFIADYFGHIPSIHRSAILVGGILFFWLLEGAWPLFHFDYNKWKHASVNIFFTITTILVNFPLAFLLVLCSDFCVNNQFGILQWLPVLPLWLYAIIGLLVLDLVGAWLAHWTQHKTKWLWQFHIVHHADHEVDTTTANRHHPGESLVRFIFTMAAIIIAGAPMWLIFLYQSLSVILSQFNHANIVLPEWLHKVLSLLIVTPNMHHVHHHYVQPYTDSNYGNIFSVWDRLFGTYKSMFQKDIVYGVDTHPEVTENSKISNLLVIPFRKYRPPVSK